MTTVIVVSVIAAWILFSAMLATIICMNSSRLSRIDEPFKDPAELAQERKMYREVLIAFASVNGCADCGDETPTQELLIYNGLCGSCFQGRCDEANKPLVPDEEESVSHSPFYEPIEDECEGCGDVTPMSTLQLQAGLCLRCFKPSKHE